MKTTLQTTSNRQGIPLENYSFTLVTRFIFWNNTPGRNAFMRKIYLLLIISIFSSAIIAQSFVEITGTPFDGISSNATSFSDIDNDNDQDVLIGSKLYTNDGTGLYEGPIWTPFIELLGGAVAFADIDNDSDQDVIITGGIFDGGWETHMSFYTKLYTNNGSGLFLEVASSSFIGSGYGSIAFADVDNDGNQDVLITGYTAWQFGLWGGPVIPQTILYLNDGSGNFFEFLEAPFDGVASGSTAFADIDNDNDQDVLITGYNGEGVPIAKLYANEGNGIFTEITGTPFDGVAGGYLSSSNSQIAFADIDNDGDLDVLITGLNESVETIAKLYTNDGSGNFTEEVGTLFEGVSNGSIAFADIDNDNDQDVLITGYNGEWGPITKLYTNDGSGNFTEITGTPFEVVSNSSIAFADIDNDSDQDVMITGYNDSSENIAKLYRNLSITTKIPDGNTVFNSVSIYPNPTQGQITLDFNELTNVSIKVFSMNGILVYHQENITDPMFQFELNTKAGIHILELNNQHEKQKYKLVKQ